MQPIISERRYTPRNSPATPWRAAMREGAQKIEAPPRPGELFFQTAIVLAAALGAAVLGAFIVAMA